MKNIEMDGKSLCQFGKLKNTKIGDKIPKRNIDERRWRWSKWIALVFKIHKPGFFKICIYIYIRKIYIK